VLARNEDQADPATTPDLSHPGSLSVSAERRGDSLWVRPAGEIDMATSESFSRALDAEASEVEE